MASNEVEVLDPAATIEGLKKIATGRALNRRNFMTALGVTGAASGAALLTSRAVSKPDAVLAAGPTQQDILNFALNLEYLEATFYSYVTQGVDLPAGSGVTQGSGAITNPPTAKTVFSGPNAAQLTDLINEIYYDELSHVIDLRNVLGSVAVARPAINLAGYAAITNNNTLSLARLLEDVGVTAYLGAAPSLTATNLTYAAQILAVESFHSGSVRLACIQNPALGAYFPTGDSGVTFTGTATAGSNVLTAVYFLSATALAVGNIVTGPGLAGAGTTITALNGTSSTNNTAFTATTTSGSPTLTVLSAFTNLAVGQIVTGAGIPAGATITAITGTTSVTLSANATATGTKIALTAGTGSVTLAAPAAATAANVNFNVGDTDTVDVPTFDPGTAALAAAGPTLAGGFFSTAGGFDASVLTPAGTAFARTSSQVLAILCGAAGVPALPTNGAKATGGFFPSGVNGVINAI